MGYTLYEDYDYDIYDLSEYIWKYVDQIYKYPQIDHRGHSITPNPT